MLRFFHDLALFNAILYFVLSFLLLLFEFLLASADSSNTLYYHTWSPLEWMMIPYTCQYSTVEYLESLTIADVSRYMAVLYSTIPRVLDYS